MKIDKRRSQGTGDTVIAADRFIIASQLQEIGDLLELSPGNERFKARAYKRGAKAVMQVAGDLGTLIKTGRLTDIAGIGRALAAQIEEIHRTGSSSLLEKLRASYPPGVLELIRVPALNLKKIEELHRQLGIGSVAELREAAGAGKLRSLRGFGARSEEKLLRSLDDLESRGGKILLVNARRTSIELKNYLATHTTFRAAEMAGPFRRFHESAMSIVLVASARSPAALVEHFLAYPMVAEVREQTKTSATVRLADETVVSLTAVAAAQYPTVLLFETGAPRHLEILQQLAGVTDIALSAEGLRRGKSRSRERITSEAQVYQRIGLSYIPPELREGEDEFESAIERDIAAELIAEGDIRGLVHCHTVYSDGKNTVEEMALAAQAIGADYLTITDHSPTAFYANGLKVDRLLALWDEIDEVQERVSVKLLKGTESDILADGSLDYPDHILERMDIIIASIHSRMKMDEGQMTRRVLGAIRQPLFKIWGHPLGRLIERRPPFACRMEEILDAIAGSRTTAIEVNGDPYRLDLEPRWIKEARRRGIKQFVISTDAHSTGALRNVPLGVGIARRGGVKKNEVLNTLGVKAFREAVSPTRALQEGDS